MGKKAKSRQAKSRKSKQRTRKDANLISDRWEPVSGEIPNTQFYKVLAEHHKTLDSLGKCLNEPAPGFTDLRNKELADYPGVAKGGMSDSCLDKCNEPMKRFDTGAVRGTDCADVRYDLVSPIALRRVAETYAEGSKKYGDSNWQKGIPTRDLLNHALKHIASWQIGDCSEDHLAHAAWNLFAIMHTEEKMPHLVSRPYEPGFDPCTDPTNK